MKENDIETRPIMTGNMLKQPFLSRYSLERDNANVDYIDTNGFYIGNSHIVDSEKMELLDKIVNETCSKGEI